MPLQETSGAASYDAFGGGAPTAANYIEDVFSTWIYTGTGSAQTITNGLDISGKGGLVWTKARSTNYSNFLIDSARGVNKQLVSNNDNGEQTVSTNITSFNANGYTLGTSINVNGSATTFASWAFREQSKFFDVVTYTGDGVAGRTVAHNLGSAPGCMIVKQTNNFGIGRWCVYHRSLTTPATDAVFLNLTNAQTTAPSFWNSTSPTSTLFTLGDSSEVNGSGNTYVAYLFSHNAGGFGLTGTDNVISCGSFSSDASGEATVTLGYEPQWVMLKASSAVDDWQILDINRGMSLISRSRLWANLSNIESTVSSPIFPTATGFQAKGGFPLLENATYIYIAIRRGPMKVPTTGTSVFEHFTYIGDNTNPRFIPGSFSVDVALTAPVNTSAPKFLSANRLTGSSFAVTSGSQAQAINSIQFPSDAFSARQNGVNVGSNQNSSSFTYLDYFFRRAPRFFDVICYTGNGASNQVLNHNLGVAPELIFNKKRSSSGNWAVAHSLTSTTLYGNIINSAGGQASFGPITYTANSWLLNAAPTATTITISGGGSDASNDGGATYFTYLFATCPGVSKVGGYTGTGATQVIDCGFTSGARFILIKAASTTGNWLVWDTVRSIGPSAEPYLTLNTDAAQVNGTDWVDPASSGFELSNAVGNLANTNGVSYIFLAIA